MDYISGSSKIVCLTKTFSKDLADFPDALTVSIGEFFDDKSRQYTN
jgi:hypothetical protein